MSRTGTLNIVDGRCVLRFERRLTHPVEKVWRAITEPAHLVHWYPVERELEPVVGGKVREGEFAAEVIAYGTVTAYDPPRLLEYSLSTEGIPMAGFGDRRTSRFELSPDPAGCLLVFVHTFEDRAGAASYATGWQVCLDALEAVLDGRPAEDFSRWTESHEDYVERFGLAEGTVSETGGGWTVRFERQLMGHPVATVWAELTASGDAPVPGAAPRGDSATDSVPEREPAPPAVGEMPPPRFANEFVPAAAITVVEPPALLEYQWRYGGTEVGRVRWELAGGPGGARITLTQTVPARAADHRATALAAWHTHLELLVRHLGGETLCWPPERTEELRKRYADWFE